MKRGKARGLRQAIVPILLGSSVVLMLLPFEVMGHARGVVVTVSVPIENVLSGLIRQAATIPRAIRDSEDIAQQNRTLSQQVEERESTIRKLKYDLTRLRGRFEMLTRLRLFVPVDEYETLTSEVIARPVPVLSSGMRRSTITILLGSNQGVRVDDLVLVGWVVVGRVVSVGVQASEVRLITDPDCSIVAQVNPNGTPGVLRGCDGQRCVLNEVPVRENVQTGDWVVTSGFKGRCPKGLFLGTVRQVERNVGEHLEIKVEPGVDFDKIDHVIVVRRKAMK